MAISVSDLVALKQKVETEKKKLQSELDEADKTLAAIELLQSKIRADNQAQVSLFDPLTNNPALPIPKMSFSESVRQAVHRFSSEEFTVANVENVLKAQGVKLPLNNVRARIATEIKELIKKKVLVKTYTGTGIEPNRYRRLERSESEKSEGKTANTVSPSGLKLKSRLGTADAGGSVRQATERR